MEFYNLDEDMLDRIYSSLSPIGWMSVSDIALETEYDAMDVAKALSVMNNIATKRRGSSALYRRAEQVL